MLAGSAIAQQSGGTLRGRVTDESGAIIPGTPVAASNAAGARAAAVAGADGSYSIPNLAPGAWTVRVAYPGFAPFEVNVQISAGRAVDLPISLTVAAEKQEVTVKGEPGPQVSTEPDNNAGALVLCSQDLESLPDDPDDLQADLQALAGPAAGPNGGQIYIDGFSGGRLPPKESIREIRINQNPFSAEYDKLGFGRIVILTKPGSDKFRGQAFMNFSDRSFDSRNPYATNKPAFQSRMYGGNLSGPLSRKASFFVDFEKRDIDDNAVVNATILDPSLDFTPYRQAIVTPNRRTTISPRIDYQLSANNTLTGRYTWSHISQDNAGIGEFSMLSRAYQTRDTQHMLQLTETSVLSPKVINETRFQFVRSNIGQLGDNGTPAINVLESFMGGGAPIGNSWSTVDHYELQNYTSISHTGHTLRFGLRLRKDDTANYSPQNFAGTFTFGGGFGPELQGGQPVIDPATGNTVLQPITSIERYRRTLYFQDLGYTPAQIRALGGGATQFTMAAGDPLASLGQTDIGAFVQDDWRVLSNLTLSLGLRYETQTNIHDWRDWAPRVGFAWAPGSKGNRQGKTVVRGGFGMFYDRVGESLALQSIRYNGINQQQYVVANPDFFPVIPSPGSLTAAVAPQATWRLASNIRAPYIMQSAIGIERQLPWNTTVATTFTNSHAMHLLRARNVNAPVPGTGVRPDTSTGDIYEYESSGVLNQNQWMTNVNSRLNRNVSLFAFYSLNYAKSNTDGSGSFPANQYDLAGEYGRSSLDVRHRFVLGGSVAAPWALRLSPFIIVHSGQPFNITTGRDNNGDNIFTDRPAFAADLGRPGVVVTPYGAFDPNPGPGEIIIPRNYGEGPGYFSVNLRLSRTFGFGARRGNRLSGSGDSGGGDRHYGARGGPGGGGGMRMGGGGMRGMFSEGSTEHRYNLTLSISARNLLNTVNPANPIGNLTSPMFGQSNSIAGGFGPMGNMANNRRVELQMRFSF
jgi:hypothetical protein